jgi:LuxR family quorum-sensing system transcriptional regulator SolR
LSRPLNPITEQEVVHLVKQIHWLTNLAHIHMSRFLKPKLAPETNVGLTAREREVLRWTGEGKTACEIGEIMNISVRTVNFHINNILQKLYATNKTQAVVKAMSTGLIDYY